MDICHLCGSYYGTKATDNPHVCTPEGEAVTYGDGLGGPFLNQEATDAEESEQENSHEVL